jgi:hypothetical protein
MSEPISNEIFETFRIHERVREQRKAIKLLVNQGYVILDLENNIINKNNYNKSENK